MATKDLYFVAQEPIPYFTNVEKTVTVNTPQIIENVSYQTEITSTNITDIALNINLSGFGEENIPDPSLFAFKEEFLGIFDAYSLNYSKSLVESVAAVDSLNVSLAYFRNISDIIKATDDILGEANIDDDQYLFFTKLLDDSATITDSISFQNSFNRFFTDSPVLADSFSNVFSKNINESLTVSDALIVFFDRASIINDTAGSTDSFIKSISQNNSESVAISDTIALQMAFNRALSDTLTISEFKILVIQNYFSDPSYSTEGYSGTIYTI